MEEAIKSAAACSSDLQGMGLLNCFVNVVYNWAFPLTLAVLANLHT
jgi:hypothetical protein